MNRNKHLIYYNPNPNKNKIDELKKFLFKLNLISSREIGLIDSKDIDLIKSLIEDFVILDKNKIKNHLKVDIEYEPTISAYIMKMFFKTGTMNIRGKENYSETEQEYFELQNQLENKFIDYLINEFGSYEDDTKRTK